MRRQPVTLSLPAEVIDGLKALAERELRAVSREAELAIRHHLSRKGK